jgi:hypothetical protein
MQHLDHGTCQAAVAVCGVGGDVLGPADAQRNALVCPVFAPQRCAGDDRPARQRGCLDQRGIARPKQRVAPAQVAARGFHHARVWRLVGVVAPDGAHEQRNAVGVVGARPA